MQQEDRIDKLAMQVGHLGVGPGGQLPPQRHSVGSAAVANRLSVDTRLPPFQHGFIGAQRSSAGPPRHPAHPNKRVRRTATAVCAGYLDYTPPPQPQRRAAVPKSFLAGIEDVTRTGAQHTKPMPGPSRVSFSSGMRATHVFSQQDLDHGELYSGDEWESNDEFDPVGPLPSSGRRMSDASSILSFAPFETEGISPTTTVSPGGFGDDYGYLNGSSSAASYHCKSEPLNGVIRSHGHSGTSEEATYVKQKRPVGRPPKKKRGVPAAPGEQVSPRRPPPPLPDDDGVVRDRYGRARPIRRKSAFKKGWKGWIVVDEAVDGPPPAPKSLINLDEPVVIEAVRRTRSGRNLET